MTDNLCYIGNRISKVSLELCLVYSSLMSRLIVGFRLENKVFGTNQY